MSTTWTTPGVGKIVHLAGVGAGNQPQCMAAIITAVYADEVCDLTVFMPGHMGTITSSPVTHDEHPETRTADDQTLTWHWSEPVPAKVESLCTLGTCFGAGWYGDRDGEYHHHCGCENLCKVCTPEPDWDDPIDEYRQARRR